MNPGLNCITWPLTSLQDKTIVIQKALSKEQIDEVISLSREFRRPAHVESKLVHR